VCPPFSKEFKDYCDKNSTDGKPSLYSFLAVRMEGTESDGEDDPDEEGGSRIYDKKPEPTTDAVDSMLSAMMALRKEHKGEVDTLRKEMANLKEELEATKKELAGLKEQSVAMEIL